MSCGEVAENEETITMEETAMDWPVCLMKEVCTYIKLRARN